MPKTVDNYLIHKQIFKDTFLIQYFSCEHKVLKKPFTIKKIQKAVEIYGSKLQQKHNQKLSFAYSCIQNESKSISEQSSSNIPRVQIQENNQMFENSESKERNLRRLRLTPIKNLIKNTKQLIFNLIKKQILIDTLELFILNQIINLLKQLHDQNVTLGNLSPSNLFFNQELKLLISNFLIAKVLENSQKARIDQFFLDKNSEFYAPQVLEYGILTKSADIYSLGKIIENLNFLNSDHEPLSPFKFPFQCIKDLIKKMVDLNPKNRPSIAQFQKQFRVNRSQNKSTSRSSSSKENQEKLENIKGIQSYKSEATIKLFNYKSYYKTLLHNGSKKSLLSKRQILHEDFQIKTSPKKIAPKYVVTLNQSPLKSSQTINFEAKVVKIQKDLETSTNSKIGASINRFESSYSGSPRKRVARQVSILRNTVSFLIEMILFLNSQNESKNLCYFLVQQALLYTNSLLKIMDSLSKEKMGSTNKINEILEKCQQEKKKLTQVALFFSDEVKTKKLYELELIKQLRNFGRKLLEGSSFDYWIQKNFSSVSQTNYESKYDIVKENPKQKLNKEQFFKILMLLKRIEYGSYLEFFRAQKLYPIKNLWAQHQLQFQRNFGVKYFAAQIRDLIAKK